MPFSCADEDRYLCAGPVYPGFAWTTDSACGENNANAFAERRFRGVVRQLSGGGVAEEQRSAMMIARARCAPRSIIVSIDVLQEDDRAVAGELLITFVDPDRAPRHARMVHMLRSFGLTPAEQKLALHLASGGRLDEAAETFELSRHTVRNQLRAVFAKLGIQRQVDLVRMVLAGCGAVA